MPPPPPPPPSASLQLPSVVSTQDLHHQHLLENYQQIAGLAVRMSGASWRTSLWDVGETWGFFFFFSFEVPSRPQTSFFFSSDARTKTSDWTPVGVLGVPADPWGRGAPHEYLTVLPFSPSRH